MVKSGTDFRDLTLIEITNRKKDIQINKIERLQIVSSIEEHSEIKAIVDGYIGKLEMWRIFISTMYLDLYYLFKNDAMKDWMK